MKFSFATRCLPPLAVLLLTFPLFSLAEVPRAREGSGDLKFTRTHNPGRVVLFVQSIRPSAGVRESITIYGDGRTLLSRDAPGGEISSAEGELKLDATRIDRVLEEVVASGLADYDPTTIRARELTRGDGFRPRSSSGPLVKILVSFDSIERKSQLSADVHRQIEMMSPQLAAEHYPEIREYAAVVMLLDFMEQIWREWSATAQ